MREPCVAISIIDPEAGRPKIRLGGVCRDVLYLEFHDEEPVEGIDLPPEVKLISAEDGKAIWCFVDQYRSEAKVIVVHCHAGISRSSAVAAAICRGLGDDDSEFFQEYQPNQHVYDVVLAARQQ